MWLVPNNSNYLCKNNTLYLLVKLDREHLAESPVVIYYDENSNTWTVRRQGQDITITRLRGKRPWSPRMHWKASPVLTEELGEGKEAACPWARKQRGQTGQDRHWVTLGGGKGQYTSASREHHTNTTSPIMLGPLKLAGNPAETISRTFAKKNPSFIKRLRRHRNRPLWTKEGQVPLPSRGNQGTALGEKL